MYVTINVLLLIVLKLCIYINLFTFTLVSIFYVTRYNSLREFNVS